MRHILLLFIFISTLRADTLAGAWETFPTKANADAWLLYSYDDGLFAPPPWSGTEIDDNPYVYSYFLGGKGVWFIADDFTAGGAFIGNFFNQKISGVDVSVNVDPAEIDYIDLVVYADGPNGLNYYYSLIYQPDDLGEMPDWYVLNFSFKSNWFSLQDGNAVPFRPNKKFLSSIQEIGLRVLPAAGVTADSYVYVDDFILLPTVDAPKLTTSTSGNNFILGFTPNPGVAAAIEKLSPTFEWVAVAGQSDLTGPQNYSTPITPGAGIFRVGATEKLTKVVSP